MLGATGITMAQDSLEPTPEFRESLMDGRALADAGKFEAAEGHFRRLLEYSRDNHLGNHTRALGALIVLYGRAGRYFEVYILAQSQADLAKQAETAGLATRAFAQSSMCGALSQLRLSEPLGEALREFRTTLDAIGGGRVDLELKYLAASGAHARSTGDTAKARRYLTAYRDLLAENPEMEVVFRWALGMSEAELALAEGKHELALEAIKRLESGGVTPNFHRLKELTFRASAYNAMQDPAQASDVALEAMTLLESVQHDPFLASDRVHHGARLARELEALGKLDEAKRIHDLTAAAVMVRMGQLDECMQQLPELGRKDLEASRTLTRFRKEFLHEQKTLLARVAALLESRGSEHIKGMLTHAEQDDHLFVCAWCESVRPTAGEWLPIGHFIPRDSNLLLTHSMCPTCASEWNA